ncbi:interferon regulatory factor 5 [Gymnodraco acuticeps]|uniref:Interferon regulatory factor 5 n=2 Tax=Notothenioidei TaxID=8205 RepID=A0A6P8TA33_GYMAC|nr:interferon regulatory factor 5 [Gymnodraco acuticeps]KAJ4922734.1 hypothetical protein JOQ06_004137 [Pogonophryne albipinna]
MSAPPRRVRLRPWLLAQVSSGRFSGLQWLDPELRLFRVPWKHATRHSPPEQEDTIFKAWALETGKYQEGLDEPDPAKWKANLRCALNKSREFQLKYDGTKETPVQPYKIYEVCEHSAGADFVDEDEEEMPNMMELSLNPRISDPPLFGPVVPMSSDLQDRGGLCSGLQDLNPPPAPMMEASSMGQNHQTCKYDLLSSVPLTDLDLKVQYRGRTAASLLVSNPQGCRLYAGHLEPSPDQVELFGPVTLQQVQFPGTSEIQNQKQKFYTDALLDVMDRGLILELWEQDLYAVRLCQCKVFWSVPGTSEPGPPNPLEREKKVRVFSLNDFLQGLILFQRGETPNPPPFEVYFCFGEDWPDKKPKEKKLIIVQVVPVVARILTEMFSGELSWSTDSIRLQISNPDVKDRTVEQFKELQRLLQSQHIQGPWTPNVP